MGRKGQITAIQLGLILYPITLGTVYFPAAGVVTPLAGTAGWLAVLLAFGISLIWAVMAVQLCKWAPAGDFSGAVFSWLGPWVGRLLLLYLSVIGLWLGGLLLLQGSLVFHAVALPATPPLALTLATLVLVVFSDLAGVEVYARTVQVLLWLILPLMLGFFFGVIPLVELGNLLPLFGEGFTRIAHAAYLSLPWPMEGAIFTLFFGCLVRDKRNLTRSSLLAILAAGLILAAVVALTLGELGRGVTESYVYPSVPLILSSSVSHFLQGLEIFSYPLWLLSSYIKTAALFVLTSQCLKGIVPGLPQLWRSMLVAIAFLGISLLPKSIASMVGSIARVDNSLITAFYGILPLLLFWVWWKRRRQHA